MDEKKLATLLQGRSTPPDSVDERDDGENNFADDVISRLPAAGSLSTNGSPALLAGALTGALAIAAAIGMAVAPAHDHEHRHNGESRTNAPPSMSAFGSPALLPDR